MSRRARLWLKLTARSSCLAHTLQIDNLIRLTCSLQVVSMHIQLHLRHGAARDRLRLILKVDLARIEVRHLEDLVPLLLHLLMSLDHARLFDGLVFATQEAAAHVNATHAVLEYLVLLEL